MSARASASGSRPGTTPTPLFGARYLKGLRTRFFEPTSGSRPTQVGECIWPVERCAQLSLSRRSSGREKSFPATFLEQHGCPVETTLIRTIVFGMGWCIPGSLRIATSSWPFRFHPPADQLCFWKRRPRSLFITSLVVRLKPMALPTQPDASSAFTYLGVAPRASADIEPQHCRTPMNEWQLMAATLIQSDVRSWRVAARQLSTFRMTRSGVSRHSRSRIGTA